MREAPRVRIGVHGYGGGPETRGPTRVPAYPCAFSPAEVADLTV